jgi:hypothetical protein
MEPLCLSVPMKGTAGLATAEEVAKVAPLA